MFTECSLYIVIFISFRFVKLSSVYIRIRIRFVKFWSVFVRIRIRFVIFCSVFVRIQIRFVLEYACTVEYSLSSEDKQRLMEQRDADIAERRAALIDTASPPQPQDSWSWT